MMEYHQSTLNVKLKIMWRTMIVTEIDYILACIVIIMTFKNLHFLYAIRLTRKYLTEKKPIFFERQTKTIKRILLLIPVLREQNIISSALDQFKKITRSAFKVSIVLAGTKRERTEANQYRNLTKEAFDIWIKANPNIDHDIDYHFYEANDLEYGDRASQLNYAVKNFLSEEHSPYDVIGVYDADSKPDLDTLIEVKVLFEEGAECCQQAANFCVASERMAVQKNSSIMVANAIYQSTWTVIRELPRWISYSMWTLKKPTKSYNKCVYLIGHGEFFTKKLYEQFEFPENEVTDGIQLGYRIAFCNIPIVPLKSFCHDDVPNNLRTMILQHKRWYGGCMRIINAYKWSTARCTYRPVWQLIDCYWSQILWAFAAPVTLVSLVVALTLSSHLLWFWIILFHSIIYSYIFPLIANKIMGSSSKYRIIDWIFLPLAIFFKSFGPLLYIAESTYQFFFRKHTIKYGKVER